MIYMIMMHQIINYNVKYEIIIMIIVIVIQFENIIKHQKKLYIFNFDSKIDI